MQALLFEADVKLQNLYNWNINQLSTMVNNRMCFYIYLNFYRE